MIPSSMNRLSAASIFPSSDFPLACLRHERHAPTALHSHEFHELVIILGGRGVHVMDDRAYPIQAGDVFLIRGEMTHGYAETDRMALVNILFEPRRLRLPLAGLADVPGYHALFSVEPKLRQTDQFKHRLRLAPRALDEAATIIAALEAELTDCIPGYRFVAVTCLMTLIGYLSRHYFSTTRIEQRPILKISEVMSFIEGHYAETITIRDLIQIAGVSESTLTRAFHKIMGHSPIEHVIRVRIGRAADLLRRTDLRVTEIAFECGFSDSNYFTRQFRHVIGLAPIDYRKQNAPRG